MLLSLTTNGSIHHVRKCFAARRKILMTTKAPALACQTWTRPLNKRTQWTGTANRCWHTVLNIVLPDLAVHPQRRKQAKVKVPHAGRPYAAAFHVARQHPPLLSRVRGEDGRLPKQETANQCLIKQRDRCWSRTGNFLLLHNARCFAIYKITTVM